MTTRVGLMALDPLMGDLNAMPWADVGLLRRMRAELARIVTFLGDHVGDTILTLATPERIDEYLQGVSKIQGWEYAAIVREFGVGPEGLVWPGHRASMASAFAAAGSAQFAGVLRQVPGPGQMFLVVHCWSDGAPRSMVIPVQLVAEAAELFG